MQKTDVTVSAEADDRYKIPFPYQRFATPVRLAIICYGVAQQESEQKPKNVDIKGSDQPSDDDTYDLFWESLKPLTVWRSSQRACGTQFRNFTATSAAHPGRT